MLASQGLCARRPAATSARLRSTCCDADGRRVRARDLELPDGDRPTASRRSRARGAERVGRSPRPARHVRALRRAQGEAARGRRARSVQRATIPSSRRWAAASARDAVLGASAARPRGYSIARARGGERWLARDGEPLLRRGRARDPRHAQRGERARRARALRRPHAERRRARSRCCARSRACRTAASSWRERARRRRTSTTRKARTSARRSPRSTGLAGAARADRGRLSKGQDLAPLAAASRGKVRAAVLIGAAADELAALLRAGVRHSRAPRAWTEAVRAARRARAARRHRAAVAGAARARTCSATTRERGEQFRARRAEAARMSAARAQPRAARVRSAARLRGRSCSLALGAVMVGSASITIADKQTRRAASSICIRHLGGARDRRRRGWRVALVDAERALVPRSNWLLLVGRARPARRRAAAGDRAHRERQPRAGSTRARWTLQASEPRVLCCCSTSRATRCAVATSSRRACRGCVKPLRSWSPGGRLLLLLEPDFGSTVVLLSRASAILFVAGARLRDFVLADAVGGVALGVLALSSPYRLERPHEVPRSVGRPLRRRLPAHAVADRDRPRRVARRRARARACRSSSTCPRRTRTSCSRCSSRSSASSARRSSIVLFAVVVYRAVTLGREALRSGMPFQALVCDRHRADARLRGVRQHRRELRPAADQGLAAAAHRATGARARSSRCSRSACCSVSTTSCTAARRRIVQRGYVR